jgi:hypothetical protein
VASNLEGGLEYESGIATGSGSGGVARGANTVRVAGGSAAIEGRSAAATRIDRTTRLIDGRTAQ